MIDGGNKTGTSGAWSRGPGRVGIKCAECGHCERINSNLLMSAVESGQVWQCDQCGARASVAAIFAAWLDGVEGDGREVHRPVAAWPPVYEIRSNGDRRRECTRGEVNDEDQGGL